MVCSLQMKKSSHLEHGQHFKTGPTPQMGDWWRADNGPPGRGEFDVFPGWAPVRDTQDQGRQTGTQKLAGDASANIPGKNA